MIPLDPFMERSALLDEHARQFLREDEYRDFQAIPAAQRQAELKALLEKPIAHFSAVNEAYFRAKWAEVMAATGMGDHVSLLEVASGDADMIPQMMARSRPNSRYISANMNRILTKGLLERTRDLPLDVQVIEEDASQIGRFLPAGSVDLVAFQHAVNDVIQAILCDQAGVDTINADWMATLPEMIRILQREVAGNTLEAKAKPAFLNLLETLLKVLKQGGFMVMSHNMYQLDLDWGYPPALWDNMIPITCEWVRGLRGCREVFFDGFNPQWWMFFQKE